MMECDTTLKKWGNSLGVIIPKELVEKEHLSERERIKVLFVKERNTVKRTFGMLKGKIKTPTQKIKDNLRKELYHE